MIEYIRKVYVEINAQTGAFGARGLRGVEVVDWGGGGLLRTLLRPIRVVSCGVEVFIFRVRMMIYVVSVVESLSNLGARILAGVDVEAASSVQDLCYGDRHLRIDNDMA